MAGPLSGWLIPAFQPIAMIPTGTRLTAFHSDTVRGAAGSGSSTRSRPGSSNPHVDRVFSLDDVAEAHRYLEDDQATGKVVLVP